MIFKITALISTIYAESKITDHFSVDSPGSMYMCTKFDKNTIINKGGDAILVISEVVTLISRIFAGPKILDVFL